MAHFTSVVSKCIAFACIAVFLCGAVESAKSQKPSLVHHKRSSETAYLQLEERLKPFYHGVASGDPLPNNVIIWTRVTPEQEGTITGKWYVTRQPESDDIVVSGDFSTDAARDYTVKVDVGGLEPGTTYYYWFEALGATSLTGRMRTASVSANHVRLAVVSCNSFPHGFFNAFARIADRNDIDAVLHLGDYIYEYGNEPGEYGSATGKLLYRLSTPPSEIIKLADYRTRYSQYRLDKDFRRVHQQQTFITIWDDHEFANDAYVEGAENHTEGLEGSWNDRKSAARQAYFEWLPVRDNSAQTIYRSFSYGSLLDIIMLDTRIEGRDKQAEGAFDPSVNDTSRTLLGSQQLDWFAQTLADSEARWKIVGNQVIFAPVIVEPLGQQAIELFLDVWNGYPAERRRVLDIIKERNINNTVILTGDFHTAFAFDVPDDVLQYRVNNNSLAVEFAVPSISSANFDENLYAIIRNGILVDGDIPDAVKQDSAALDGIVRTQLTEQLNQINGALRLFNPHLKEVNLVDHGYLLVDITPERVQGEFYFVDSILTVSTNERFGMAMRALHNRNTLEAILQPALGKAVQELQAPDSPRRALSVEENMPSPVVLNFYPNPTSQTSYCTFSIPQDNLPVLLALFDSSGRKIKTILSETKLKGIYTVVFDLGEVADGVYYLQLSQGAYSITRGVVVKK